MNRPLVIVIAAIASSAILGACNQKKPTSELNANFASVCSEAQRELTSKPFKSIGNYWSNCSLVKVADKNNDPTKFGYTEVVQKPDACIIEYTDTKGEDRRFLYDRANGISSRLDFYRNDDGKLVRYAAEMPSASNVFHIQLAYDAISVTQMNASDAKVAFDVDRQYIGLRRRNLYVYTAVCEKQK